MIVSKLPEPQEATEIGRAEVIGWMIRNGGSRAAHKAACYFFPEETPEFLAKKARLYTTWWRRHGPRLPGAKLTRKEQEQLQKQHAASTRPLPKRRSGRASRAEIEARYNEPRPPSVRVSVPAESYPELPPAEHPSYDLADSPLMLQLRELLAMSWTDLVFARKQRDHRAIALHREAVVDIGLKLEEQRKMQGSMSGLDVNPAQLAKEIANESAVMRMLLEAIDQVEKE